jgi:lysozyme
MISSAILLSMCVNSAIAHEGFSHKAHRDSHGTLAIGYGYNLTYNQLHLDKKEISKFKRNGISELRARQLATNVCLSVKEGLEAKFGWFNGLSNQRASVMMDMGYNLGLGGLTDFDKTLNYVAQGRTTLASKEMLHSRWARQVKGRAVRLAEVMKTGKSV